MNTHVLMPMTADFSKTAASVRLHAFTGLRGIISPLLHARVRYLLVALVAFAPGISLPIFGNSLASPPPRER